MKLHHIPVQTHTCPEGGHKCHRNVGTEHNILFLLGLASAERDSSKANLFRMVVIPHTGQFWIFSSSTAPCGEVCLVRREVLLRRTPRLPKRSLQSPDFRYGRARQTIWENKLDKPKGVHSPVASPRRSNQQLNKALDALFRMDQQGKVPSVEMYRSLLRACTRRKALSQAKVVQAHLEKHGLESTRFLGESLVKTLVRCGGLNDALELFHRLSKRSVVSWTAVISGYIDTGQVQEALRAYESMQASGVKPNAFTFVSLLRACSILGDVEKGQRIHADALEHKCGADLYVCTALVDMYGKCGKIVDAQDVFDGCSQRDLVSWNAMLAAYARQGQAEKVLQLYGEMGQAKISPDDRTFVSVIQGCGLLAEKEEGVIVDGQVTKPMSLAKGMALHADIRRMGHDSNVFVGNTLVTMYGKCGSIVDAENVFDGLLQRDVVSWTAMLVVYAQQGQADKALKLYMKMQNEGVSPDAGTFVCALQVCGMLAEKEVVEGQSIKPETLGKGKAMHAELQRKGYCSDVFVGSTLLSMYGKCGSIVDAENIFDALAHRDVVAWSAMLTAYAQQDQANKALQLYEEMWEQGVTRDAGTFISVLEVCGMIAEKEEDAVVNGQATKATSLARGKVIHADLWSKRYDNSDVCLDSSLLSMYGKCGSIADAEYIFDGLSCRDGAAWCAMLSAYCQQEQADKALQLYEQMCDQGISPEPRTFVNVIQASGMLAENEAGVVLGRWSTKVKSLTKGKIVHATARTKCYDSDVFLGSSLITMYGKCGSIVDAQNVFEGMCEQNVVSWTAMLAAYVEQGHAEKALHLYRQMQQQGLSPNEITVVCMLHACSKAGSLAILRIFHDTFISTGGDLSLFVANTLIHAYGRCASMVDAQAVFDELAQPTVVSWNALIAGYAREGDSAATLQFYEKMQRVGVKPNGVTFLSLLSACSHAGLLEKGVEYFESMSIDHSITPQIDHYVSMVDLLGRAGCFKRIQDLLSTMPMQPSMDMWLCLLGACQKHAKVTLAEHAFRSAVLLQPEHAAPYTLMSNIYASVGLFSHANQVRREGGAWKESGRTWTKHEEEIHTYVVGNNHPNIALECDLIRKTTRP